MQQNKFRGLTIGLFLLGSLSIISNAFSAGGIVTDNTLGLPTHSISKPNSKDNVTIMQNVGKTVGHNLFHSFEKFNIESGQTVTFKENTPNSLDNVISRVTGGSRSDINGTLQSTTEGHADFYLINPSGVVFGRNAFIDVPAGFHVSTADELNLKDGGKFSASHPEASHLSAAAPSAFGFLGTSTVNNGLIKVDKGIISVKDGQNFDLTSGQILLTSAIDSLSKAGILVHGGNIRVLAIRGKGIVDIDKNLPLPTQSPTLHNSGDITLRNSFISTSEERPEAHADGGRVSLWGYNIALKDSSRVTAVNNSDKDATSSHGIDIQSNHLKIENNSFIGTQPIAGGDAGDIRLKTGTLSIIDDGDRNQLTGITSETPGIQNKNTTGDGGSLFVSANTVKLLNGGEIRTITFTQGQGGNIQVTANDVKINGKGSSIKAYTKGVGNAGNLTLNVNGKLTIQDQGQIHAATFREGHGGNVGVTADNINIKGTGAVDADRDGFKDFTGISAGTDYSEAGIADKVHNAGDAGNVTIIATGNLSITNSGEITALTRDKGNGGSVQVIAKNINIDGDRSAITASTISFGNAGKVTIKANGKLTIKNGGQINAATFAEGNGGNVNVTANNMEIDGEGNKLFTGVSAGTDYGNDGVAESIGNAGDAGNVAISANGNLSLKNGGQITTLTRDKGNGGNIQVAAKNIDIIGVKSSITATTESFGNAGNVGIKAVNGLNIKDGGAISARTSSVGKAGNINILADALKLDSLVRNRTGVFADTVSNGDAGNITITARTLDINNDDSEITSSTSAGGRAGDIAIKADRIKVDGGGSLPVKGRNLPGIESSAKDGSSGNGGNIKINSSNIGLTNGGFISTSTQSTGTAGSVLIHTDKISINKGAVVSSASIGAKSSGRTGNIGINAKDTLNLSSGSLRITNEAMGLDTTIADHITPGNMSITAHDIQLTNSKITSESFGKVAAGAIDLKFTGTLSLNPSFITTNANEGNGGGINIKGGELIRLQNSGVTTSVKGSTGNGGNIDISADTLIMETGLIQANTAALGGSGGDINLNLKALITSGNMLTIGGSRPIAWQPGIFGFNVIQAAAPSGLSGQIQSSAPQLNLSGELSNLGAPQFDTGFLSQEYCLLGPGSSLRRLGKGGLLPKGRDAWVY